MRIITLLNEKGGVGKTTNAVHIAAGLASRGRRVVLVDADPQGHAGLGLGVPKQRRLYELLVQDFEFDDVMIEVPAERWALDTSPTGRLMVIPSNVETRVIPQVLNENLFRVVDRFEELAGLFDVAIFDTPPTPSLLHGMIYLATDAIIYPTMLEAWSLDGLMESFDHREGARVQRDRFNLSQIEVLGIIPTKYRSLTLEHRDNLQKLRAKFGELVWRPVAERTIWAEAATQQRPVYRFAPGSDAALECWEIVDRVEGCL